MGGLQQLENTNSQFVLTETATVGLDHSTSQGGLCHLINGLSGPMGSVVTLHGLTGSAKKPSIKVRRPGYNISNLSISVIQ